MKTAEGAILRAIQFGSCFPVKVLADIITIHSLRSLAKQKVVTRNEKENIDAKI